MFCQPIDPIEAPSRTRWRRVVTAGGVALVVMLTGCFPTYETLSPPEAESDPLSAEATLMALTPAVEPVIDVLKQARSYINTDNMASTIVVLSNFPTLWDKATAVIEPLAGEQWPPIEAAATRVISIFDGSSIPEEATAKPAIEDLMNKLQSLLDQ